MSQIQKLIDKLNSKPTPNDMTFEELAKIARYFGCDIESRGNHQRAIVHDEKGTVIPIPCHSKHVGVAYVKQVKVLLTSINREED